MTPRGHAVFNGHLMPGAHHPPNPATILVVEDDEDTREYVVMLVGFAGYQTLEAATGRAALAVLATEAVDGVLLDLRLPDMDGLAVCRHVRGVDHRDLPIILVTADQAPDLDRRAAEAGVTTILAKPFAPEALVERLKVVLPAGT